MSTKDESGSAFPWRDPIDQFNYAHGMTKRETIAMHLMAGILAKYTLNRPEDQKTTAQAAVECADALLEALG
jgi:hypothetical protein